MKTVLLIDDSPMVQLTFGEALRTRGYHVHVADSGSSGLALARQHLPDLILSDINMPGGDGSTLLQEIRIDPELKTKQVVLMTGRPDLMSPRKGMEAGADDFLLKPISFDALLNCVDSRFRRASINWRVEDQTISKLRSSVPAQLPHEVFTPLAGIIGLVDILRSDSSTFTAEELADIYRDIHQSAFRLHRTLRNYLLVLEFEGLSSTSTPEPLSPSVIEEKIQAGVGEALELNDRKDDITVRVEPCFIAMRPGDLTRIVEELVNNACKFSRHGTPVEVTLDESGHLLVKDQGRGMTPEEIGQIAVFQQFDRHKQEQQGLGIGLVLVQKLAALCGAKLLLTSEPGKGTEALITFPLALPRQFFHSVNS